MKRKRNPVSGPAGKDEARELYLYATNNRELYQCQFIPIVKNLLKKIRKGTYKKELAVKLWMYYVDANAKMYAKEFSIGSDWNQMFNKNTRLVVAKEIEDYIRGEIDLGNYD